MPRFVVLYHSMPHRRPNHETDCRSSHWDFMLEAGASLRTWALSAEPDIDVDISAMSLADHRIAYLEYEGPVSNNRGHVTRYDSGTYEEIDSVETHLELMLLGTKLRGRVVLRRTAPDSQDWIFRRCGN